ALLPCAVPALFSDRAGTDLLDRGVELRALGFVTLDGATVVLHGEFVLVKPAVDIRYCEKRLLHRRVRRVALDEDQPRLQRTLVPLGFRSGGRRVFEVGALLEDFLAITGVTRRAAQDGNRRQCAHWVFHARDGTHVQVDLLLAGGGELGPAGAE